MTPPPANLRDAARLDRLSLYAIFNTLALGVEGTDMPAFADQLAGPSPAPVAPWHTEQCKAYSGSPRAGSGVITGAWLTS